MPHLRAPRARRGDDEGGTRGGDRRGARDHSRPRGRRGVPRRAARDRLHPRERALGHPEGHLRHVGRRQRADRVLHLRRHPDDLRAHVRPGRSSSSSSATCPTSCSGSARCRGPNTGTTVFAINRAPFGPNGSRPISFFNWLTQIGFEVEGLILIVGRRAGPHDQGGVPARRPGQGRPRHRGRAHPGHPALPRPRRHRQDAAPARPPLRGPLRRPARLRHPARQPARRQAQRRLAGLHRGARLHHRAERARAGPRTATTTPATARRTPRRRASSAGSSSARPCPRSSS